MFSILYTFFLHLLGILMLPILLYKRLTQGKYKESLSKRMGAHFPQIEKEGKPLIWIHAISMGETKAVTPFVKLIKEKWPDCKILFSNITETGHAEAKKTLPADYHVYLPFDLPYIIRPIVQKVQPDIVIITETDFWFHFQDEVKKNGGKIFVINGKMSKRSLGRYRILPWLTSPLFQSIDLILAQSEIYRERFLELGILPDRVKVTGNIKLDDCYPTLSSEEVKAWKEELGIHQEDPVIVIGSTHEGEEKILLQQIKKVWKKFPRVKILLAPRHPERFKSVKELLDRLGISCALWSKNEKFDDNKRVLLVDVMGKLRECYQLADIAIVAGSFTNKVGGHNLLEPSWYEKPVLYGPHVYKQQDFDELIKQKRAGLQIDEEDVAKTIMHLFQHHQEAQSMGKAGKSIFIEASGATQKSFNEIAKIRSVT